MERSRTARKPFKTQCGMTFPDPIFAVMLLSVCGGCILFGWIWGRTSALNKMMIQKQKEFKKPVEEYGTLKFEYTQGGAPDLRSLRSYPDHTHIVFGPCLMAEALKEVSADDIAAMPNEGLTDMLESAIEQELYPICTLIKQEIERRKTLPQ